jgi:large subunit ribosomal protein L29
MRAEKLREMSADELRTREKELREQLFRLRFQKSLGQLDNAVKIRETRRDIARVKTVLRQRAAGGAAGPRRTDAPEVER